MPFTFFKEMYRILSPKYLSLYLAIQADKPVGGILVSKFKNMWTSEYSGQASDSIRGVSPLIYWETIQHAKHSGAAYFSFGRTSLDNTGLLIHKRRWGTIEEDLIDYVSQTGTMSVDDNKYSTSGDRAKYETALRLIMRLSPPAVQKLIGNFTYSHLG